MVTAKLSTTDTYSLAPLQMAVMETILYGFLIGNVW